MFSKIIGSKIFLLLSILAIGYLGYVLTNAFLEKRGFDSRLASLNAEIEELEIKKDELKENEEYFASRDFLEKEARRLLNYQKPDEEVVAVIPNKNSQAIEEDVEIQEEIEEEVKEVSNPEKWWQYFFSVRD